MHLREQFLDWCFPLETLWALSKDLGETRLCFLSLLIKIFNETQEVCWSHYCQFVRGGLFVFFKLILICCFVCSNLTKFKTPTANIFYAGRTVFSCLWQLSDLLLFAGVAASVVGGPRAVSSICRGAGLRDWTWVTPVTSCIWKPTVQGKWQSRAWAQIWENHNATWTRCGSSLIICDG